MIQDQPQPLGQYPQLTHRQYRAIECLITCPTNAEAAREAGVSLATLYRWLKTPAFRDVYRRRHAEALLHVIEQTGDHLVKVFQDLTVQLNSPDPQVRLQASKIILDYHHSVPTRPEA